MKYKLSEYTPIDGVLVIISIGNLCLYILYICIFEEFKFKNRDIHFYQFEIFAIKAAKKQRK